MKKQPPEDLIAQRPVLEGDPSVVHPSMGTKLGSPPRKYTKAVHEVIVSELKSGQRPQGACARAGITLATFHDWVKRGKAGDPWLYEFAEDVEIAFNMAEANAVDVVHDVMADEDADTRLKAASYWLERARPDGYSKQVKTLVDKQIENFMIRLEEALDPALFEKVLAVYMGHAPAAEMGSKVEVTLLPEHDEPEQD